MQELHVRSTSAGISSLLSLVADASAKKPGSRVACIALVTRNAGDRGCKSVKHGSESKSLIDGRAKRAKRYWE